MLKAHLLSCLLGSCLTLGLAATAQAAAFFNAGGTINDNAASNFTFDLSSAGFGNVAGVTVTINGLTHANLYDLELYLIAPNSDVLALAYGMTGTSLTNATLSDTGAVFIDSVPNAANGTFLPTEFGTTPPGGFALASTITEFAGFKGADPNGLWTLQIYDVDSNGFGGTLSGATLNVTDAVEPVPVPPATAGLLAFAALGAWKQRRQKSQSI